MDKFDENEYQRSEPKQITADFEALVAMLRITAPLFLAVLLINFLFDIFS